MSAIPAALRSAVEDAMAVDEGSSAWAPAGGSALNAIWRVSDGARHWFVKVNGLARRDMLDAEAAGLRALGGVGALRVPRPFAVGTAGEHAFLVLEWLDLDRGGRDAALGRALAELHRATHPQFGWTRDNTIGTTPQVNAWHDDWGAFFRDCRLAPQVSRAIAQGFGKAVGAAGEDLLARVPDLLSGHRPAASLLHGDLWSGNAARLRSGEPVVFDPAVYFGDREADLAMTELFGGFSAEFHAAYREAWPLPAGYAVRRDLYNLYHVLNHLNLFGDAYLAQAQAMLARLRAELR